MQEAGDGRGRSRDRRQGFLRELQAGGGLPRHGDRHAAPGKPPREAPPVALVGGLVGVAVLVALVMVVRTFQSDTVVVQGPTPSSTSEGPKVETPVSKALLVAHTVPKSYDQAAAIVRQLEDLKGDGSNLADKATFDDLIAKATAVRERFIPLVVTTLLDEAEGAYKKRGLPTDAIEVLNKIPGNAMATQGPRIAKARRRYDLLASCFRRSAELLSSTAEDRFIPMSSLLAATDSKECGFPETDSGKKLDAACRLAQNAYIVSHSQAENVPDPAVLKRAKANEDKGNVAAAESDYRKYLLAERENLEALLGVVRCQVERERRDLANDNKERIERLGAGQPPAALLGAWIAWVDGALGCEARARDVLKNLPKGDLGRLGKRLKVLLDVGAPTSSGRMWRVFAPTASKEVVERTKRELAGTIDRVAAVYGLRLNSHLDAFVFGDDVQLKNFTRDLDLVQGGSSEGRLTGCYAVALTASSPADLGTLPETIARALAVRATGVPGWLTETLPEAIARPVSDGEHLQVLLPAPTVSLEELEKTRDLKSNPKALESARAYAALASTQAGCEQLGSYVLTLASDAQRARTELEAQLRVFRQKQSGGKAP